MCKSIKRILFMLCLLVSLSAVSGTCSAATEPQVTMSMQDFQNLKTELQQLKANNEKQRTLYETLKKQVEQSENQQNLSAQDWTLLEKQLSEEQQKVTRLETLCETLEKQLAKAEQSSMTAQNALTAVNQSFAELSKAIQKERAAAERKETILKIIAVGALAYAATK